jgi:death on curing protein
VQSDPTFIGLEEAIRLHAFAIGLDRTQASSNVRDTGLLESALTRPQQLHYYEDADLPALAATLLWGLVLNHPFHDGNKRTGWFLTQAFLYRNGYELPTSPESTRLVLNIALGRRDVSQVERWIRTRLGPIS